MTHYVYRHRDAAGALLYVGCTSDLAMREAFRKAEAPAWLDEIASTDVDEYPSRREALDAERVAIETEQPAHNIRYARPATYTRADRTIEVHGYALREIRELRARKVADLAAALDVDRSYITHLENGSKRRVSAEFYNALCAQLLVKDQRALLAVAPERVA